MEPTYWRKPQRKKKLLLSIKPWWQPPKKVWSWPNQQWSNSIRIKMGVVKIAVVLAKVKSCCKRRLKVNPINYSKTLSSLTQSYRNATVWFYKRLKIIVKLSELNLSLNGTVIKSQIMPSSWAWLALKKGVLVPITIWSRVRLRWKAWRCR